jgi:hypothetical protein
LTYYCWRCYAVNGRPRGACVGCGGEIAAPAEADYVDRLLWSLRHPLPDRRMIAAHVLGRRRELRARQPLLELAVDQSDPYLAAQALSALVAIDGTAIHRKLLERLAVTGAAMVKRVATDALAHADRER